MYSVFVIPITNYENLNCFWWVDRCIEPLKIRSDRTYCNIRMFLFQIQATRKLRAVNIR